MVEGGQVRVGVGPAHLGESAQAHAVELDDEAEIRTWIGQVVGRHERLPLGRRIVPGRQAGSSGRAGSGFLYESQHDDLGGTQDGDADFGTDPAAVDVGSGQGRGVALDEVRFGVGRAMEGAGVRL